LSDESPTFVHGLFCLTGYWLMKNDRFAAAKIARVVRGRDVPEAVVPQATVPCLSTWMTCGDDSRLHKALA
jgi:hypothetical protein